MKITSGARPAGGGLFRLSLMAQTTMSNTAVPTNLTSVSGHYTYIDIVCPTYLIKETRHGCHVFQLHDCQYLSQS